VHIAVPDVAKAMDWYQGVMGGLPAEGEPENRLFFGNVRVCFLPLNASHQNNISSIHHVGFIVTNLTSTINRVVESGGTEDGQSDHAVDGIMIRDPWGTKLELFSGDTSMLDHIEIRSSDPLTEAKWLQRMFGGELSNLNGMLGLHFDEAALVFSEGVSVRSQGTLLDHIGWRTDDIEQTVSRLRKDDVRFLSDIEPRGPVIRVVFVESPSGVKVEILQR